MPTYDYRCDHCGHEFSRIQSFTEGAIEVCPNCGQRPTRLMSLPSIVFKGSGWYKTDSRRGSSSDGSSSSSAKTEKTDKTEKSEKTEKGEKRGDTAKTDKPADSGGGSTASGGSGGTGG